MHQLAVRDQSHKPLKFQPAASFSLPSRQTSPLIQRKAACACGGGCPPCQSKLPIQTKLAVSEPGDVYEQEADRVAEQVMRMPVPALQRSCASCTAGGSTCPKCYEGKKALVQRKAERVSERSGSVSDSFVQNLGPDQLLDPATRSFFEPRFGHDFSQVRVHTDGQAAESVRAVNALAYTVGRDVVFGGGQYAPGTKSGLRLLAHELTHTLQQAGRPPRVQCQPQERPAAGETPHATAYHQVTMRFDGSELIVFGDSTQVFRFSAQSGRPLRITAAHAAECGANAVTDTYMNDKRFVGIGEFGPIPEGRYRLVLPAIQRFTPEEERRLVVGGITGAESVAAAGTRIHPGDWGSGRVPLTPIGRVREGPCGNANRRSGFYLHGGLLAGSSGCIDIGGNFDRLADFLQRFRSNIVVSVEYTAQPPSVGYFTGLSGAIAYGGFDVQHGPRGSLGAEFGPAGLRFLGSAGYDVVLAWAGGALGAGLRLDVPMDDRSAFLRAGLDVDTNFRLFRGLYGQLTVGATHPLAGEPGGLGLSLGAGLEYDFGFVQLEALYRMLNVASGDQRVHQVLVGIGFRFGRD
jgi:hypothetical protein